jgi:hypothetical protein
MDLTMRTARSEKVPYRLSCSAFPWNLDNWAPALIDALPSARRVVTFDNVGVDGSSGGNAVKP